MAANKFMFDTKTKSCNNIILSFLLFWAPLFLWMGLIFFFSSLKGKDIPSLFCFQDIVFHFVVYAGLGFLFARCLKNNFSFSKNKIVLLSCLFGLIYGVSDEFHQIFVPGRTATFLDLTVDTLGALIGGFVFKWLR